MRRRLTNTMSTAISAAALLAPSHLISGETDGRRAPRRSVLPTQAIIDPTVWTSQPSRFGPVTA
jgi:hypothetical protein